MSADKFLEVLEKSIGSTTKSVVRTSKTTLPDGTKQTDIEVRPSYKGAMAGVSAGALIGSAVPVVGTAVGGAVGGLIGFIFGPD